MPPDVRLSPPWAASSSAPLLTPVDNIHTMQLTDSLDTSSTNSKQKEDKLPHDASVFVGRLVSSSHSLVIDDVIVVSFCISLPSNMDQGDLTRLLMEHLSEHAQVKNIKVVRDSKGGVCAFVQCEVWPFLLIFFQISNVYALQNAQSATSLIQTLQSSVPKPFLGRILRYEPARAFRSLLVSYRWVFFNHFSSP